jgi:hypothetical protein
LYLSFCLKKNRREKRNGTLNQTTMRRDNQFSNTVACIILILEKGHKMCIKAKLNPKSVRHNAGESVTNAKHKNT